MTTNGPKRGDLEPDLVIDVVASPTSTDLNLVESWKILGRRRGSAILVIDAVPTVDVDPVDEWKAVVTYPWAVEDTAVAGLLLIEIEATWPGGLKQTFPTSGYIQIRIAEDLG